MDNNKDEFKPFILRMTPELKKQYEDLAKKENDSLNAIINKALEHFISCKVKAKEDTPNLKEIVVKYEGVCSKCKVKIPMGSRAFWAKDKDKSTLLCYDCQIDSLSNVGLAKLYRKKLELHKIIQGLNKEAEEKAESVNAYEVLVNAERQTKQLDAIIKLCTDYITQSFTAKEEREFFENLIAFYEESKRTLRDISDIIRTRFKIKIPVPSKPIEQTSIPTKQNPNSEPNQPKILFKVETVKCVKLGKEIPKLSCLRICPNETDRKSCEEFRQNDPQKFNELYEQKRKEVNEK